MRIWLAIILLAAVGSLYSAAVEAFVTWGLIELFASSTWNVSYWNCYIFWYIVGFIIASYRLRKLV